MPARAATVLTGTRIRERRLAMARRQADIARAVGISPAYLNLIEHNQRSLTFPLLLKIAGHFDVDLDVFSDEDEARLLADYETCGREVCCKVFLKTLKPPKPSPSCGRRPDGQSILARQPRRTKKNA